MMETTKPGAVPTAILNELGGGACFTVGELVDRLEVSRRQVTNGALRLLRRDYLMKSGEGCFKLTETGLAAAAAGEVITSGPKGATGAVPRHKNTFRERAWRSMRIRRRFTIGDVTSDADSGDGTDAYGNARRYIAQLKSAGYVAELPRREVGSAIGSNGFKRFILRRDTGPVAPVFRARQKCLHDFNLGEDVSCSRA